jgi:CspA family cold shock protein
MFRERGDRRSAPAFPSAPPPRIEVPAGPPTTAVVKWFNAEKGFGFVELADGTGDAFLHMRVLERAGHTAVSPGTTLQVRAGHGQKGLQVTEVLEVDASTATPEAPRRSGSFGSRAPADWQDRGSAVEMTGLVKFYNAE